MMADAKYILALDQGTTSSRSVLFDRGGAIVGVSRQEFRQSFPAPGQVEHDPEEIWTTQRTTMDQVLADTGATTADIAAVGITNQRETVVVWERATGRPIHPAIVWQDRRTAPQCDALARAGHADRIQDKTGLVIDPYFSGTKAAWILDHVDGARERAEQGELAFGTIDSWLVWKLTEGRRHVTESSNASRTMLFNIRTGAWDDELLAVLGVPRPMMPEVVSSSEVYGEVQGIPLAGMAGDQQAALFGQACFSPGMAKNTYGTGCFLLWQTGRDAVRSRNRMLSTVAWRLGTNLEYALEGSVFMGGATVQWLRDGLGIITSSADVEALAASVPDTGGVYLVPAFAGLGAPHWDAYARGTLVGMTRGTSAAHIARAALEAIALQCADVLDAMHADAGEALAELRVDGGACANNLLMQFQADLLGVPVVRPRVIETTALGAAYLAGLATGFYADRSEIAEQWQAERRFEPLRPREEMDAIRGDWRRALDRAREWAPRV